MIKPKHLRKGSRIAAVTLSWGGPGAMPHRYEAGKRQLEKELEVEVVELEHTLRDPEWIERHPEARAADLMAAFSDPSIDGIVSSIGGEESVRILPFIDLEVIRRNPKVFLGYSDTSVTHYACYRAGLVSFYGPSFMAGFAENCGMFPYMVDSLRRVLFRTEPIGVWEPDPGGWTSERLDWAVPENQAKKRTMNPHHERCFLQGRGVHRGHLMGGCMEVLEFLKGTDTWPAREKWDGAMLFLETSEEAPPPMIVARWLRNLGSQGILQRAAGVLYGRPGGETPAEKFGDYDAVFRKVITEELGLDELPIVTGLEFGHTDPMFVIPHGVELVLDMDSRTLSFPEAAVV